MDEQARLKAREYLLRSRIYRFFGLICAVFGVVLFVVLYFKYIDGDIVQAFRQPILVGIVLIPFLPAFILSWMATKAENKFMKALETIDMTEQREPEKTDK